MALGLVEFSYIYISLSEEGSQAAAVCWLEATEFEEKHCTIIELQ